MISQMPQTKSTLRGGGCGSWKTHPHVQGISKSENQELYGFFNKFNIFVEKICSKAVVAAEQSESQEIMLALQWFIFQGENIYKLNKNVQGVVKSYDLILEGIKRLLKSCLLYIRTDSFKCLYILQTTASLSKVIFSFHVQNGERFIRHELQKEFLDISDELRIHIETEKNDLIQNQLDLYLFLTKTSFEMAPNNSNEREEILKGCLSGIIGSLIEMKPNEELLESLFQGACHLYKLYVVNNNRKQFEVYFQIDMLQWEIISYFQNEKLQNLDEIILQIEEIYNKIVKNSNIWKYHYLWVQMIGNILQYNPLLTQHKFFQLISTLNFGIKSNEIWKEFQRKGLLIQMNHSNEQAVIQLNQIQNNQLSQIDRTILETCFKEWETFLLLKDVLMNEEQQFIPFTLGSYLKCKLEIGEDISGSENVLAINNIKRFLGLIIPNKLLTLIKQNDGKLDEVIKMCRNFRKDKQYNESIKLKASSQQIKKMIQQLQEYFKNTLIIIKIMRLDQSKSKRRTQYKNFEKLNTILRIQVILKLYIIQNQRKQSQNNIGANDYDVIEESEKSILEELKNIDFKEYKFPFLELIATEQNKKQILQEVEKLIEIFQTEIHKLEINLLQNNILQYFENLLINLQIDNENMSNELQHHLSQFNIYLKEIMIIMCKIELAPQILDLNKIKQAFDDINLLKYLENLKYKITKLNLILVSSKKSFLLIIEKAKSNEIRKLIDLINLDEFLRNVIQYVPKRIFREKTNFDSFLLTELKNIKIIDVDFEQRLTKQKGILKYLIFRYRMREKMIDEEKKDLELIYNEFEEFLIKETPSQLFLEKINTIFLNLKVNESIENVIDEKFNLSELRLEKEKYSNFLSQLRQLEDLNKFQVVENWNSIIMQTEMVIKAMEIFGQTDKEIVKILIKEELMNLNIIISEHKITKNGGQGSISQEQKSQEVVANEKSNQDDQIQLNAEIENQFLEELGGINQISNKFNFCSNHNYRTHLSFMIKVTRLRKLKLQEETELLNKLLEEVLLISGKLDQALKYKIEIQTKFQQRFQCYIQEFIKKFEFLQMTEVNLNQKEDENFDLYLERIETNLFKRVNDKGISQSQINITDYLNQLEVYILEKVIKHRCFVNTPIEQDFLFQKIKQIYFEDTIEVDEEEEPNQQLGLLDNLIQNYKDFINNEQWKIKQGLVFTIIQISSNCYSDKVTSFCQKVLIQLWVQEKDQRVRNILKNQHLISLQMQILKKNWQTQQDRIAGRMQQMLSRIDELQEQIFHEANVQKQDLYLKEMDEITEQLDEQVENINEMGQQLKLITDFVNHIRKGLIRVEGKINEMKEQLKSIGNDIKFLRGKSVDQLLEIRKWKVLKEAAQKNAKSIYIPLQSIEIFYKENEQKELQQRSLINLEQINDTEGEVNQFLLQDKKTVALIHGVAGSGKSTIAKKIEEFIWKLHDKNQKIRNQVLIPVYISLPSLKNPVFQAVEEALHQDEYSFDELQLKECKEMLQKKKFRLLLIMDSYDEMKLENIQKNLYLNNKLKQNWSDPLVIFTTRSEIFTSSNYPFWFAPNNRENLKEIQLQKFNSDQILEYLKKFTIYSIKMLIFEIYEWQALIQNRGGLDINKFEIGWEKLQEQCLSCLGIKQFNDEVLINQKQIDNIVSFLKNNQFFNLKSSEALRSLSTKLQKLWSIQKYEKMMKQINLHKLIETPYMMEIIVQVLPKMVVKASEIINLKLNFMKNFPNMLKESCKSHYLIKMYRQQQKNYLNQANNEIEQESLLEDSDYNQEVTQISLESLDKIDYNQIAFDVWNKMEENLNTIQFFISQQYNEFHEKIFKIFENNLNPTNKAIFQSIIQKEKIIEVACDALQELNLTSYDFYDEFINQYHYNQIEKQRNLGKSIQIDRFLYDIRMYSINLAKIMSTKQMTQVQYQQQGFLYQDEKKEEMWLNEFFNDDDRQFGSYKKDLRSCSLVQQKGTNFQFVHKSLQEFYVAADLYSLLVLSKDLNLQILNWTLEQLSKEQNSDQNCLEFLSNQMNSENRIQNDISVQYRLTKVDAFKKNIESTLNLLKILEKHEFSLINYSTETYIEMRKYLIQKIKREKLIIEFLKFLVYLTAFGNSFIQAGSNSFNLLVEMKVDLTNHNFEKIRIRDTSLVGGNFANCILSLSEFNNVNINGINLNRAQLFGCKWKNLKINDLHSLNGHSSNVQSVNFSPDGTTLASCSSDKSIRLWDVKTGQQKARLDGHLGIIYSVNFSPDGTTLASGSDDKSIRLWDVKTGQQKAILDGHTDYVKQVCFSPDGTTLASGSGDNSIRLWDARTGQQNAKFNGYDQILSVNFSPNGITLASGGAGSSIILWDVNSRQQKSKFNCRSVTVTQICFSPDGATLASSDGDIFIHLWDVETGQYKAKLEGHSSAIYSINFSPDGTTLASGSEDISIRLWDVKTGQQKAKLDGHIDQVLSVCFSPDGIILASGSGDKSIRLWDVRIGQQKAKQDGHSDYVMSVNFSPDGTTLASGSGDKSIRLWDVNTGQQKAKLDANYEIEYACFSPNGTILAASCYQSIQLWDIKTGQQKAKLDGHLNYVFKICFSPDGTTLASCSSDKSIRLWDVKAGQQKAVFDDHSDMGYTICFSPDGSTLASSIYNSIHLWDAKTGQQQTQLDGHTYYVRITCFSPDGTTLASGSGDKSIRFWNVKTGQQKAKLEGHSNEILSVNFSPDGTTLASGSSDCSIRLWDVKTGQQKAQLDGHFQRVRSVCFSPDGDILASGSEDNTIRFWDIKSKQHFLSEEQSHEKNFEKFKLSKFRSQILLNHTTSNITVLLISNQFHFQSKGALIYQGEFVHDLGIDLKKIFQERGSQILEEPYQQIN